MNDDIKAVKQEIMTFCKCVRKRHKVTQKRMAALTGVSDSAFSLFENGRFNFDIARLYYAHIMSEGERSEFQICINDLKNKYIELDGSEEDIKYEISQNGEELVKSIDFGYELTQKGEEVFNHDSNGVN